MGFDHLCSLFLTWRNQCACFTCLACLPGHWQHTMQNYEIFIFGLLHLYFAIFPLNALLDLLKIVVAGNPAGIKIHAVFVAKASGEMLRKYSGLPDMELWIIPTFENSAWSIMAISFICLLAMSAVLATCFFVRRHRIRREQPRAPHVREFHGMSSRLVKAMPSLIFTSVSEDNCTSMTCAICLEDYNVGEKLRVLPCRHSKFFDYIDQIIYYNWCFLCWGGLADNRSLVVIDKNSPTSKEYIIADIWKLCILDDIFKWNMF